MTYDNEFLEQWPEENWKTVIDYDLTRIFFIWIIKIFECILVAQKISSDFFSENFYEKDFSFRILRKLRISFWANILEVPVSKENIPKSKSNDDKCFEFFWSFVVIFNAYNNWDFENIFENFASANFAKKFRFQQKYHKNSGYCSKI